MSTVAATVLPELDGSRFLTTWEIDPAALAVVLVLAALYTAGVVRLRRRGERWSAARTVAFAVLGLGTLVVATMSAFMVYSRVLFWPAAVQNIMLDLIVPLGLALGDPLTLAGRALSPGGARRLEKLTGGLVVRFLTFPFLSTVLVLVSEMSIYFTSYFQTSLEHYGVRQLMHLQLLFTGCLFVLPMLTKQDLLPRWCTHPIRALLVFMDGLFDSIPGIVVLFSNTLVAGHWYAAHPRTWGPPAAHDQQIGGGLMLTIAELVGVPFLFAVFVDWWRTERSRTAELDERLDRELVPVSAAPAGPAPAASAQDAAPATASAETGTAASGTAVPPPDRVRPWWETEGGEVADRMRRGARRG
ncbi:cytochrome c oxidase assembly protein [Streptantibioticus silvisoli]|uniref:Cytochrome c oxidase assembly protein n=1 Tax=Streptantibioticus silvisoli TaxID=2705255 RepID=A0ABT6VXD2_9ACTN|nr:cytochrome c oxidase assembly protein [Streptantibioticus silvisoli]MDI5963157.1 cytochrome c oxidase assembly protein [Streptantibioticus silvisoli]